MTQKAMQGAPVLKWDVFEMNDNRAGVCIVEYVVSPETIDQPQVTPFLTMNAQQVRKLADRLIECAEKLEAAANRSDAAPRS